MKIEVDGTLLHRRRIPRGNDTGGKVVTLAELEAIYMDGFADEVSGDTDAPTGFFYRIGTDIVVADTMGFIYHFPYHTEGEAQKVFADLDAAYDEWDSQDA